jgi:tRNA splicing endonuclease
MFDLKYGSLRNWRHSSFRETKHRNSTHGLFDGNKLSLDCRHSIYKLWKKIEISYGKGSFSRSEPLFQNPNPAFNSIGKANREKRKLDSLFKIGWKFEKLNLSLNDIFFLRKKKLKISNFKKKKQLMKTILGLSPELIWNYIMFNNFRNNYFFLKSGLKFGGDFITYRVKGNYNEHFHSTDILYTNYIFLNENECKICSVSSSFNWLNIQNRVRLSQQVSKNFTINLHYEKGIYTNNHQHFNTFLNELTIHRDFL